MYDYCVRFDSDEKVLHRDLKLDMGRIDFIWYKSFDILWKYNIIHSKILFGFQSISMSLMQFPDTQVTPTYSKCIQ